MNMPIKLLSFFVFTLTLLAGCVPVQAPAASTADQPAAMSGTANGVYPLTVENCGHTLTFDRAPETVLTHYHPSFELLAALGVGDKIKYRLNYNEGPILPEHQAAYAAAQEVSESISAPPKEVTVSLKPDLVVSEGYYNFNGETGKATVEELMANGTMVYITGGWCGRELQSDYKLETVYIDILNLGNIFGIPAQAEALVAEMRTTVAAVQEKVADRPKVRVYAYDSGEGPLYSYGKGLSSDLISLAGGELIFADQPWFWEANIEAVAATAPEAFVIVDYPPVTAEQKFEFLCTVVPAAKACTEKRYVAVPAVAFHPGYRNPYIVETIARVLHAEAFQ